MALNPFVLEQNAAARIAAPDIEVHLAEQYGQLAEDLIVSGLLAAWAQRHGRELSSCNYLEIGANHPFATSSSYLLHKQYGMTGVLVEANPDLLETLRYARPADVVEHCAVVAEDAETVEFYISNQSELSSLSRAFVEDWRGGEVGLAKVVRAPALRVNALLEKHFSGTAPTFLAVDVEGMDLDILKDLDWQRWRPVIVQAEPSDHFKEGQSTEIIRFMHEQGYVLAARTAINLIFADRATLFSGAVTPTITAGETATPKAAFVAPKPRYGKDVSVGIIMRTKNRAVLLRRALESVKNQSYPHWQLVIVNDGGTPEPVEKLVQAIFGEDRRVSIIHHPESVGMEGASNAGLARLQTELAVVHDDDDSWAPEMLAVATQVLRQRNASMPSVRGIATRINMVEETVTGNLVEISKVEIWNENGRDRLTEGLVSLPRMAMRNLFPPIGFIFDLSVAREMGGFDDELPVLGDWDFNLRFCTKHDIWIHPEPLAFYHLRKSASGDLGNTVVAGQSKHELYNTYVRNKWLRNADDHTSALIVMLREEGLRLETIEGNGEHLLWLSHNRPGFRSHTKKEKGRIAAFLSDLNRKRKERRKRKSRTTP